MNVAFFTPRMIVGGAERYILEKIEWLKKEYGDNSNYIIVSKGGIWENKVLELGGKHYKAEWINEPIITVSKKELKRRLEFLNDILENEKIDIIEANQVYPAYYATYLMEFFNKKAILNVLSEVDFMKSNTHIPLIEYYNKRNLYYNLDKTSNNEIEKSHKIKLSNCINIPIPIKLKECKENIIKPYVLSVCRMSEEKMYIKFLIKDFSKMCMDYSIRGYNLIVVGDGKLFNEVRKISEEENKKILHLNSKIIMEGTLHGEQLEKYFRECEIYVGMGTTLLTAASFKKPSIIATFPPNDFSKAIGYFGNTGNLSFGQTFEGMNPKSFCEYIYELKSNPEKYLEISSKGYETVKNNYEISVVMKKWQSEYNRVLNMNLKTNKKIYDLFKIKFFKIKLPVKEQYSLKRKIIIKLKSKIIKNEEVSMKKILFIANYPDENTIKDGMMQRIKNIDDKFSDFERVYIEFLSKKKFKREIIQKDKNLKIIRINLIIDFIYFIMLLKEFKNIYVHSIYNFRHIIFISKFVKIENLILDVHGTVPEEIAFMGNLKKSKRYDKIEKVAFKKLSTAIFVTNSMKNYYENKYPELKNKRSLVYSIFSKNVFNFNDKNFDENNFKKSLGIKEGEIVFIYSGNIQKWQNFELMTNIIEKIQNNNYKFIILTGELEAVKAMLLKSKVDKYKIILDCVLPSELYKYYKISNYGFVLRDEHILNKVSNPTKLIEYLYYGIIPIVKYDDIGDFKSLGYEYINYNDLEKLKLSSNKSIKNMKIAKKILEDNEKVNLEEMLI